MAIWYCNAGNGTSTGHYAIAQWAAGVTATVGDLRRQLAAPAVGSERVFRCTTGGTTGGAEPTWVLTKGATTADNTAVWTEVTGNSAYGWTACHARLTLSFPRSGHRRVSRDAGALGRCHAFVSDELRPPLR